MSAGESTSYVAWAKRVNGRWIVHEGLGQRAGAYLNHLAAVDPARLERSCRLAFQLVRQSGREDPKPWFYAGLFSLATLEEAREFLARHRFTLSAIPTLSVELNSATLPETLGPAAREKIDRIRQALTGLLARTEEDCRR